MPLVDLSNIVTHLHLPIQSGSDRILKKMNRHYTVEHYKELLSYCREKIKDVVVTTDIIVGFLGKQRKISKLHLQFLKDVRYDMAYTLFILNVLVRQQRLWMIKYQKRLNACVYKH